MSFQEVVLKKTDAMVTESQAERLNGLCAEFAREGIDAGSLAGSLIGTGLEILIQFGVVDEIILGLVRDELLPGIRRDIEAKLTPAQMMDRYGIKRKS